MLKVFKLQAESQKYENFRVFDCLLRERSLVKTVVNPSALCYLQGVCAIIEFNHCRSLGWHMDRWNTGCHGKSPPHTYLSEVLWLDRNHV